MRSKTWSRRLWKSQTLLLFFIIGTVIVWDVEFVNGQSEEEKGDAGDGVKATPTVVDQVDLSPTGNCSEEIKKFCTRKTESALDCISKKLRSEEAGNDPGDVSEGCKQEWRDLKVLFYRDPSLNKKIEAACKEDIKNRCENDHFFAGGVLTCLREAKSKISQSCQDEVFAAEQDAVDDYKMDTLLSSKCNADVAKYCKGVKSGGGRIQACLRDHSGDISFECNAQLFRQERENADDLRLNPELYKACINDQKKFCAGVSPGNSRVKDCLESNRLERGFSASCKAKFDKMLARRSADFRLNPTLMAKCEEDINLTCDVELQEVSSAPNEPKIIHCLQDERDNLKSTECKNEVHKLLALAAEDYRFDKWFSDSCEASKQKYCKGAANDKVLSCLQTQRGQLDTFCRAALFNMEWRLSGDIDYKFAMKQACVVETGKFCHGLQHDRGAIIECLQEKVDDPGMGLDCKKEIVADQVEAAKDYRLNYRIYKDCREDVHTRCSVPKTCAGPEPCGGVVLQCLQEKIDQLSSEECKKDVLSFEIKESKNEALNIPLQTACHDEIIKYCHSNKDHSKALACLRRNRDQLKNECKNEELRFSVMEASDIRLTPSLMNACGAELNFFCPNVAPTNGEAFKCLQLNLESINMGVPCKVEVDLQGARQASDYRLDVRVRKECKDDVNKFCSDVGKNDEGHATVLKCFVEKYRNLTGGCQTEVKRATIDFLQGRVPRGYISGVAYAVRMALFQYKFDSDLTVPCDEEVKKLCNVEEAKPIGDVYIGTFGQCLMSQRRRTLNPGCKLLVRVGTRDGLFLNGNKTVADIDAAFQKYKELVGGDNLTNSGVGIFWVTTVVAFVAILAVALFRRYSGPPKTYTLVVKQGDL